MKKLLVGILEFVRLTAFLSMVYLIINMQSTLTLYSAIIISIVLMAAPRNILELTKPFVENTKILLWFIALYTTYTAASVMMTLQIKGIL